MLTALLVVSAALSVTQTSASGGSSTSTASLSSADLALDDDLVEETEPPVNETDLLGELLGGPCEESCADSLAHVSCNKKSQICECEAGYPVRLGAETGCAKPVNLGEQCFYYQTCMFTDQNADCVQIKHNAICQCKEGFHLATVQKPQKRVFCTQDLVVIATDLSTLLGVASGLAIFTALICFVLKLFSGGRPRHYANTNLAPPIIFAQSASVHSSTSSTKSFSARQYERERENRLLAKARERERGDGGSTSPRSLENLLDGPLPSESWPRLEELKEGKAFCPEMLDHPPDGPFPDIDGTETGTVELQQTGSGGTTLVTGSQQTQDTSQQYLLQTHGIENPLGSLIDPFARVGKTSPARVGRPPNQGERREADGASVWVISELDSEELRNSRGGTSESPSHQLSSGKHATPSSGTSHHQTRITSEQPPIDPLSPRHPLPPQSDPLNAT